MKDYYKILGVAPDCSQEDIKKAYRKLARDSHPDTCGDQDSARFRSIQEAYETIGTTEKRQLYDQQLKGAQRRNFQTAPTYSIRFDNPDFSSPLSFDNWFDRILNNFFQMDFHAPIFADLDNQLELILTQEEAAAGGMFGIKIPVRQPCPVCRGTGSHLFFFCDACQGQGQIFKDVSVNLQLPPAIRNYSQFSIPIADFGFLNITVVIH